MSKLFIKNRFGVAPNELLNDENISLKAKGLFTFLQSKPDNWEFSVERIAKQTKDGKNSVRSAIKELEEAGYLVRTPVKDENGRWAGYDYILFEKPSAENRTTVNRLTENLYTLSKKKNSKKDTVKKKEINHSFEKFFNVFWEEYPKKVKKQMAKDKLFKVLRGSKEPDKLFEEIMEALRRYKKTKQWQEKEFIPHPTTWLNQRRWEDEIDVVEPKKIIEV